MCLVPKYGMVAHSTPQVSLQDVIHYLLITKSFVNGLENIALWNCSWKFICLVVGFSGAEMWSSKAPDCQDVGKKIYSLSTVILIVLQRKGKENY